MSPARPAHTRELDSGVEPGRNKFHIVHFDCHGWWGKEDGSTEECFMVLEDENGLPDYVPGRSIASLLNAKHARHVVLNACRSAVADVDQPNPIGSLAAAILSSGVQEVTAMAYKLPVSGSADFLAALHFHLLEGCSGALAVMRARDTLMDDPGLRQRPSPESEPASPPLQAGTSRSAPWGVWPLKTV